MAVVPREDTPDPFACGVRGLAETRPGQRRWRSTGPLREVVAPAGGPAWVVTEEALARAVLTDPRIGKDTALAPAPWRGRTPSWSRPRPSERR